MFQSINEALQVVKNTDGQPFDETRYLKACEYLVENRNSLTHRVYINLPGGLSGNIDPRWNKVKEGSDERCGCGNERVILPGNQRTVFEASELGVVVVSPENAVYLKPIDGDKASTYMKLWIIEDAALAFMNDPFAPLVLTLDIFSTKGYKLDMLAEVLPKQTKPPVMVTGEKIPIFAINAVSVEAKTVTITPDKAVEAFNPDTYNDEHASHRKPS